jgi:hypothetical protein
VAVVIAVPSEVVLTRVPLRVVSLVEVPVVVEEEEDDVTVVEEELWESPVTLNCWDCARIPVLSLESERRLIW